jgi:aspartate/methionine/tyrosine aminotransferase
LSFNSISPFEIEEAYNLAESDRLYDLSSACMPSLTLTDILELYAPEEQEKFCFELLNKNLNYSSQYGSKDFREKLARQLYPNLNADNFLLTCGASEGIYMVSSTLFESGDSIIVQKPMYQSLYQIASDHGVQTIDWNCDLSNYRWDISALKELIAKNPDTKALVINNPNNPTGLGFSETELKEISAILGERILVSDEVCLALSPRKTPSVSKIHKNTFVISDLSKSFNMPGLRMGWIGATNSQKKYLEKFSSHKNYLSLRCPTLSELIGTWVLEKSSEIANNNKKILSQNTELFFRSSFYRELFINNFSGQDIDGLNCFLEFKADINIKNFFEICKQKRLFLAGGELFGDKYLRYCRIGLGQLDAQKLNQLTQSFLAAHS